MQKNVENKTRIDDYPNEDNSWEDHVTRLLLPILENEGYKSRLADTFGVPVSDVNLEMLRYVGFIASRLWHSSFVNIQSILNGFKAMKDMNDLLGFYCIAFRFTCHKLLTPISTMIKTINDMRAIFDQMATYYAIDYMMKIDRNTITKTEICDLSHYFSYRYKCYDPQNLPIMIRTAYENLEDNVMKMSTSSRDYLDYAEQMRNRRFNPFNVGVMFFSGLVEALEAVYRCSYKYDEIRTSDKITNMMQTLKCINEDPCHALTVAARNNCFNCYRFYALRISEGSDFNRDRINQQLMDWINGSPVTHLREFMGQIFRDMEHSRHLFVRFINIRKDEFRKVFPDLASVAKYVEERNIALREIFEEYYSQ